MNRPITKLLGLAMTLALIVAMLPAGGVAFAGKAAPPTLSTLEPGGFRTIEQDLTINVVFVGYEQGGGYQEINEGNFLGASPERRINSAGPEGSITTPCTSDLTGAEG